MIVLWKGSDQIFLFFFGPLFSFLAGVLVTWAEHVTVSHFLIKFFLRRRHLSLRNSTRLSHKSKECTVNCDSTLPANASKSDDMSIFLLILFSRVKTVGLQPALVMCSVLAFVPIFFIFFIDPDLFQIISSKWTDCFSNVQATATRRVVFITVLFVYKAHICVVYS